MNDEREEAIDYSRRDAEFRMVDADLWIQDPELLYGFEPEEAHEQWMKAYAALGSFADVAAHTTIRYCPLYPYRSPHRRSSPRYPPGRLRFGIQWSVGPDIAWDRPPSCGSRSLR